MSRTTYLHIQEKSHLAVNFVNFLVIVKIVLRGTLVNCTIKSRNFLFWNNSSFWIKLKLLSYLCSVFLFHQKSFFFQNDPIRLEDGQWACPYCPRTMKAPSNIRLHMLTHTGEKPFACTMCSYASNKKGNLQSHMKLRHGANLDV